jgi:uracil phosphoribosyltransferase
MAHRSLLTVLDNPVVKRDITILRNKQTGLVEFRAAMHRISTSLANEAAHHFAYYEHHVETPLEITAGISLLDEVVLLPIIRAGLGLTEGFLYFFPSAKTAYIGIRRNEETLQPEEYYYNFPPVQAHTMAVILDPMLATGGSICATIERLRIAGVQKMIVCSVISAPEGIRAIHHRFPEIPIITAQMDRQLNDVGYIVPGLGDAGDRLNM